MSYLKALPRLMLIRWLVKLNKLFNMLLRFYIGSSVYMGTEIWHHNSTHKSMGLVGGVAFLIGGAVDELLPTLSKLKGRLLISVLITALELFSGVIWNYDHSIWNYLDMPFNLYGQICLPFFLVWFFLFAPLIQWLDNELKGTTEPLIEYLKIGRW